jgi:hypothetical protein
MSTILNVHIYMTTSSNLGLLTPKQVSFPPEEPQKFLADA